MTQSPAFSVKERARALDRFVHEEFDLLIVGGGITGVGVARDAASRGLKVALVERDDFASGTSSRSSKLIHGGVRYLENLEFHLVFEALSERAHLLKTAPHMVRPLKFFFPIYQGDRLGMFKLSLGLWLYDLLALFRAPGFHRMFFRRGLLKQIPFLRQKGLKGGFSYFDASMWDDVLTVEVARSAAVLGAAIATRVEALSPIWESDQIRGFKIRDTENANASELTVRAKKVVICAGPWTDAVGSSLSNHWVNWLAPSKGVHLIFDLKRIPIPGAMVMTHPEDGRIAFVIPRPDYGAGVVIVGTTDGPSPSNPAQAIVEASDVKYLLDLLGRYFPDLKLQATDILSAYVGVRPLMGKPIGQWRGKELVGAAPGEGGTIESGSFSLQKVSREHHIDRGPGGTVLVAGGKYTTFRKMAEEIVDFMLEAWREDARAGRGAAEVEGLKAPSTKKPINLDATPDAVFAARHRAASIGMKVPAELWERYGGDALKIMDLQREHPVPEGSPQDPLGFPFLAAQLRYSIRHEMCMHLTDFYLRRIPLYASRADHGLPWAEFLAHVWREERNLPESAIVPELEALREELAHRSAWKSQI